MIRRGQLPRILKIELAHQMLLLEVQALFMGRVCRLFRLRRQKRMGVIPEYHWTQTGRVVEPAEFIGREAMVVIIRIKTDAFPAAQPADRPDEARREDQ